jgi:hypothetical protein
MNALLMTLIAGTLLGPYEISGPLGAGEMGKVYRARDIRLGRDVALKILPAELADNAARRQRFEFEARAIAAPNHPNIGQTTYREKSTLFNYRTATVQRKFQRTLPPPPAGVLQRWGPSILHKRRQKLRGGSTPSSSQIEERTDHRDPSRYFPSREVYSLEEDKYNSEYV